MTILHKEKTWEANILDDTKFSKAATLLDILNDVINSRNVQIYKMLFTVDRFVLTRKPAKRKAEKLKMVKIFLNLQLSFRWQCG